MTPAPRIYQRHYCLNYYPGWRNLSFRPPILALYEPCARANQFINLYIKFDYGVDRANLSCIAGRRAIGAFPGAGGPSPSKDASESSSSPYMTLTPYHPVAKPAHKRALVPGASPWAPAAAPTTVDPAVYAAKKADFISQLF